MDGLSDIRILWRTDPFFNFRQAPAYANNVPDYTTAGGARAFATTGSTGGNSLDGSGNRAYYNVNKATEILSSPRWGRVLWWSGNELDLATGGVTLPVNTDGLLPSGYTRYSVRFDCRQNVSADCIFVAGADNANVTVYYGASKANIGTPIGPALGWSNQLRQDKHWTGKLSQLFMPLSATATGRYWRVDFTAETSYRFTGILSHVMLGKMYTLEANLDESHRIEFFGEGRSSGGVFNPAHKEKPVFRRADFPFPFLTKAQRDELQQMFWQRINGDPVVIQYNDYDADDRNLNTIYGVIESGIRMQPRLAEKFNFGFRVNEIVSDRTHELVLGG